MGSRRRLLIISDILLQLFVFTISKENIIEKYCNYDYGGTYTSNSMFRRNLDTIPSFFTSNATFYNFSIGMNPDKVNVIALCRGDIRLDTCRSCLNETNSILRENCTEEKESIIWSDNCMLRYSDRAIFNTINTLPNAYAYNKEQAPDANQFNKAVRTLLDNLRGQAARGSSVKKFATGNMSVTNSLTIYGLVQCTPDLTGQQCSDCLNGAAEVLPQCCNGRIGGREVRPSCNLR